MILFSTKILALPNTDTPTTFLGPTIKGDFTRFMSDTSAFSVAAEAGAKNVRLDGTLGFRIWDNQRLKLSAEYLTQNIDYPFFSGNTAQWVQQGSLGGDYQYELGRYIYLYNPQLDVNAYYSHAPSKSLRVDSGIFVNNGILSTFNDDKRIAGSNGAGISPGLTLSPWYGGQVGIRLHYDDVHYDVAQGKTEDANGFGGTAQLKQMMTDDVEIGASASVRQPFNAYQAHLTWLNVPFYGDWSIGVIGDYTIGKNQLPDTYNVGLSIDYLLERCPSASVAEREEALDFLNWTAASSAHLPQVLAIPDEKVTTTDIEPF